MNLSIWDIMGPAFFELLILVGIHSYLGLHVIRRKVIFVDLALAQIAALGTTVGFLFGIMPDSTGAYWFSLLFTFIGAAVFSISRIRHEKIPQEAVIGLAYAIAAAVSILVIDKAPHGAEHIKEILTGSILWVKWHTIRNAAIMYSIVGIFHFIFRKQFLLISEHPKQAYEQGMNVRLWDFLFYVSFGAVITHSVGTAGVLLVFVFLVVPAITSMLITDVLWKQLAIGWGMGLIVSILGLYISYIADLPSGPTVVAFYGAMLVLVALTLFVIRAEIRSKAIMKIAIGIGVTLLIIFGFYVLGSAFQGEHHEHHHEMMNKNISKTDTQNEGVNLSEMSDSEITKFLASSNNIEELIKLFNNGKDDYTKFKIAERITSLDKKSGEKLLFSILKTSELPFVKEEVYSKIKKISGKNFGYDAMKTNVENKKAFEKIKNWVNGL